LTAYEAIGVSFTVSSVNIYIIIHMKFILLYQNAEDPMAQSL